MELVSQSRLGMLGYKHLGSRLNTWIWRNFTMTAAHHGDREYQVWNQNTNSLVPWWIYQHHHIYIYIWRVQHCTVCSIFPCSRMTLISPSMCSGWDQYHSESKTERWASQSILLRNFAGNRWQWQVDGQAVQHHCSVSNGWKQTRRLSARATVAVLLACVRSLRGCTQGTSVNVLPVNLFTTSSKLP